MLSARVGANIKAARKRRGWTLVQLAEAVSPPTSHQQISRLERGDRGLDMEWLDKIGAALDVDPVELVTGPAETAGLKQPFTLSESVGAEVARVLGRVALNGEDPSPGTLQVLSLMLQELFATFLEYPQAANDLAAAKPMLALSARRSAQ